MRCPYKKNQKPDCNEMLLFFGVKKAEPTSEFGKSFSVVKKKRTRVRGDAHLHPFLAELGELHASIRTCHSAAKEVT